MRCIICHAAHVACGTQRTGSPVTLSDMHVEEQYTMSDLREYSLVLNGVATTAMLTNADAARLGAVPVDAAPVEVVAVAVETKARTAEPADVPVHNKRR